MNPTYRRWVALNAVLCCCLGCAATPYHFGEAQDGFTQPSDVTIAYGHPNRLADGIGYVVGLPERLLTLHPYVNNHQFSDISKDQLVSYLEKNNITDVYVRVNQYDPLGEWRRLRDNSRIAPGWKYTVGLVPLTMYTLVPGRIFGGDLYNPFTNSLYINSDVPAVVLHEAAYAKDVRFRRFPGTYAAVNEVPFVSLWRHARGIDDVLGYARSETNWEIESETYRVVYPMIGIHIAAGGLHAALGNEPLEGLLFTPLLPISGALAGHAVGELAMARRLHELGLEAPFDAQDSDIQLAKWRNSR